MYLRSLLVPFSAWALVGVLAGCTSGSGQDSVDNPPPEAEEEVTGVVYPASAPAPNTPDVGNYKLHVWDNLAAEDRCGGCHTEGGQSPAFVRRDDINLAYTETNAHVDLNNPGASRLVTKVATGHNCWTQNISFCEERITDWITQWASDSGVELQDIALKRPEEPFQEVSASLTFTEQADAFAEHVYDDLRAYCGDCHRADAPQAPVQPYFASSDVNAAYRAAQSKMLFNITEMGSGDDLRYNIDASRSRLVVRLREEAHNCWNNNCVSSSATMEQNLEAFAELMPITGLDDSLVSSKAMRIGDGTAMSADGRIESNAVALYQFKAGSGTVANDYSDASKFPPQLDLNLYGNVEWVSNWGIRFNDGRVQGSVALSRKLHQYITQTGEYSVEAWVVPANVTQDGPARIVSYSGSNSERNFTLGQTLYNYNFSNRSSETDVDGAPMVSTPDADEVLQATLQHVVASFDPFEGRTIYVNGQRVEVDDAAGGGSLMEWDPSFALVLGNETSGEYPWRGQIRFLAIHNRVLSDEDVQANYEVGVGQKILLAFSVAHHIPDMDDAYIVFQVEQFDDYSYLFNEPYFFSFDDTPASDVVIKGLRIGVNGREANVGQAFANLDVTVEAGADLSQQTKLSRLGAIIPLEKGPEQDQFFLSFDQIGTSVYTRETTPVPPAEQAQDIEGQADIGVRTFAEINASFAAMTGVAVTHPEVAGTYETVEQQMPSVEDIKGFLVAHQMGITQLAVKYCNVLATDAERRAAFFPAFSDNRFDAAGRSAVIQPLMQALLAHRIASEDAQLQVQPLTTDTEAELNALIDTMTAGCDAGQCPADVAQNTLTAACAAALGSAVMLVQ